MIRYEENPYKGTKISVIGVGGGGSNAINYMMTQELNDVNTIAINTDAQHLSIINSHHRIQIGKKLTQGKGSGGLPEIGRKSMEEDIDSIKEAVSDSDLVFLTSGLGGGTGTGGLPVLAQAVKELNILTAAVVTKPFAFEGPRRIKRAEKGLHELKDKVDTLIVIPNDKLMSLGDLKTFIYDSFSLVDQVLYHAVKGIVDIIQEPGYINVDFADVRNILRLGGRAIMGIGVSKGEKRGIEAARNAISSPMLENVDIKRAKGILLNIIGDGITTEEFSDICKFVQEQTNESEDVELIAGIGGNNAPPESLSVTVIAAGIEDRNSTKKEFEPYVDIGRSGKEEDLNVPAFVRMKKKGLYFGEENPENGDFLNPQEE